MPRRALRIVELNVEYLRSVLERGDLALEEWSRLRQRLAEQEAKYARLSARLVRQMPVNPATPIAASGSD